MNKTLITAISAIVIAIISTVGNIYQSSAAKTETRTFSSEGRRNHTSSLMEIKALRETVKQQQEDIKTLYIELARHNCPKTRL
jgi:hypothetical protein